MNGYYVPIWCTYFLKTLWAGERSSCWICSLVTTMSILPGVGGGAGITPSPTVHQSVHQKSQNQNILITVKKILAFTSALSRVWILTLTTKSITNKNYRYKFINQYSHIIWRQATARKRLDRRKRISTLVSDVSQRLKPNFLNTIIKSPFARKCWLPCQSSISRMPNSTTTWSVCKPWKSKVG